MARRYASAQQRVAKAKKLREGIRQDIIDQRWSREEQPEYEDWINDLTKELRELEATLATVRKERITIQGPLHTRKPVPVTLPDGERMTITPTARHEYRTLTPEGLARYSELIEKEIALERAGVTAPYPDTTHQERLAEHIARADDHIGQTADGDDEGPIDWFAQEDGLEGGWRIDDDPANLERDPVVFDPPLPMGRLGDYQDIAEEMQRLDNRLTPGERYQEPLAGKEDRAVVAARTREEEANATDRALYVIDVAEQLGLSLKNAEGDFLDIATLDKAVQLVLATPHKQRGKLLTDMNEQIRAFTVAELDATLQKQMQEELMQTALGTAQREARDALEVREKRQQLLQETEQARKDLAEQEAAHQEGEKAFAEAETRGAKDTTEAQQWAREEAEADLEAAQMLLEIVQDDAAREPSEKLTRQIARTEKKVAEAQARLDMLQDVENPTPEKIDAATKALKEKEGEKVGTPAGRRWMAWVWKKLNLWLERFRRSTTGSEMD